MNLIVRNILITSRFCIVLVGVSSKRSAGGHRDVRHLATTRGTGAWGVPTEPSGGRGSLTASTKVDLKWRIKGWGIARRSGSEF